MSTTSKKIIDPKDISGLITLLRKDRKTIATLNGSFDLLHAGHLYIIEEAKKSADILIMLLNTDNSIKGYKGPDRPIISLNHRLELISALQNVDYVSYFDEATPISILSRIKPNVHVNGAEYGTKCIESDIVKTHGGVIKIVPLVPGLSTSNIIDKICAISVP